MSVYKVELGFTKLSHALRTLEAIYQKPKDAERVNIDATIQRFEFTIELFWKLLKAVLEEKGVQVSTPKDVLKESYQAQLIANEEMWLQMLYDRNLTSHTYDEALADQIYLHIQTYVPFLRESFDYLWVDELVENE